MVPAADEENVEHPDMVNEIGALLHHRHADSVLAPPKRSRISAEGEQFRAAGVERILSAPQAFSDQPAAGEEIFEP